jgi:pyrophosphatase PpaX
MPLSAIIFDLDGTLADTMDVCIASYQHTIQKYQDRWLDEDTIAAEFGRTEEGILKTFLPDLDQDEILAEYLHHYARLHQSIAHPFPGILPLLDLLRQHGLRLAIVTGKGEHSADISVEALGLQPYFERIEIGHPDYNNKTDNINRVLAGWGIDPSQVAYVGDMASDMYHAKEAGVLPIAAAWSEDATVAENNGAAHFFRSIDDFRYWVEKSIEF